MLYIYIMMCPGGGDLRRERVRESAKMELSFELLNSSDFIFCDFFFLIFVVERDTKTYI